MILKAFLSVIDQARRGERIGKWNRVIQSIEHVAVVRRFRKRHFDQIGHSIGDPPLVLVPIAVTHDFESLIQPLPEMIGADTA